MFMKFQKIFSNFENKIEHSKICLKKQGIKEAKYEMPKEETSIKIYSKKQN